MRLASLDGEQGRRAAILYGQRAVALDDLDPSLPRELTEIVLGWPAFAERVLGLDASARDGVPVADVRFGIPFHPRRIMGVGGNYADHLGEMRASRPADPSAFLKLPGTAVGPGAPLALAAADRRIDYEGEIALVVGSPGQIAGLMLANDITARDVPTPHITLAKGRRGFCPLGPWLVTTDELDLHDVTFTVQVNGEPRQAANSATMIHSFTEILASYARAIPLEPGDVVLTGTPAGSGIGQQPPRFLQPGDAVVVSSPQLGSLATPVVAQRRSPG